MWCLCVQAQLVQSPSRAGCSMCWAFTDNSGANRKLRGGWGPEPWCLMSHPSHSLATLPPLQLARYTKEGFLHLGALGTTTLLPDTRCLVDNSKSRLPQLLDCDKVKSSLYKRWNFIQVGSPETGLREEQVIGGSMVNVLKTLHTVPLRSHICQP